jgi:hypothetical protein
MNSTYKKFAFQVLELWRSTGDGNKHFAYSISSSEKEDYFKYAPYLIRPQYVSINLSINLNVIRHKYFKLRVYMEIKKFLNAGRENGS